MAYRSRKDVIASIKSRDTSRNGVNYTIFDAFLGRDPLTGKVKRLYNHDRAELMKEIQEFYRQLDNAGPAAVTLSAFEAADARQALDFLKAKNLNITLIEAVRRVSSGEGMNAPLISTVRLGEAYERYTASIEGKSPAHKKSVRFRVGKWVSIFGPDRLLSDVSAPELKSYLKTHINPDEKDIGQKTTYNKVVGDIKTFMRWCAHSEQGLIAKNPIEDMKKIAVPSRVIQYSSPADVRALFAELVKEKDTHPEDLADAICSFFMGMRQAEIERIPEGPEAVLINLEEGYITVRKCKGWTRGIRPRTFTIPEQAMAWIKSFDFMRGIMKPNPEFRRRMWKKYLKNADIELPKNAGRHTFCTMFEAVYHDQAKLSGIVGNTEDIRATNYNGVASEKEGKEFFSILPDTI